MPFEICISEVRLKDNEMEKMLDEKMKIEIIMERLNDFLHSEDVCAKVVVNTWI